jgi:hypothetical protein
VIVSILEQRSYARLPEISMDSHQNFQRGKRTKKRSRRCYLQRNRIFTMFEGSTSLAMLLIPSTMALAEGSKKISTCLLEGERSRSTSSERGETTYPGNWSVPFLTPQLASLSFAEPNLTKWGLLLSKKHAFNPVSNLSVKAARSCSLSNLEFLNLAKGEQGEKIGGGKNFELALCIRSGPSSHEFCTLVEA